MNKIRNSGRCLKVADSLLYLTVTFDGCCSSSDSLPHPKHWLTQPHNSLLLWDLVPHILWSLESQSIVLFFNRGWWGVWWGVTLDRVRSLTGATERGSTIQFDFMVADVIHTFITYRPTLWKWVEPIKMLQAYNVEACLFQWCIFYFIFKKVFDWEWMREKRNQYETRVLKF